MKMLSKTCFSIYVCMLLISSTSQGQNSAYQNTKLNQPDNSTETEPAFNVPEPVGFVNDFEKLFSETEIKVLDSIIMDFNNKSTIQIAVITIDKAMIQESDMNDFTRQTFNTWGLQSKGSLNGILISLSRGYKKLRIETGSGVEQVLSDVDTKEIINNIFLPLLKEGKYYKGTHDGLLEIINKLKL